LQLAAYLSQTGVEDRPVQARLARPTLPVTTRGHPFTKLVNNKP